MRHHIAYYNNSKLIKFSKLFYYVSFIKKKERKINQIFTLETEYICIETFLWGSVLFTKIITFKDYHQFAFICEFYGNFYFSTQSNMSPKPFISFYNSVCLRPHDHTNLGELQRDVNLSWISALHATFKWDLFTYDSLMTSLAVYGFTGISDFHTIGNLKPCHSFLRAFTSSIMIPSLSRAPGIWPWLQGILKSFTGYEFRVSTLKYSVFCLEQTSIICFVSMFAE